jgi:hypothetical protein
LDALQNDARPLYRIAAPSTPGEARQAVLDKAATPEGISRAEVDASNRYQVANSVGNSDIKLSDRNLAEATRKPRRLRRSR